MSNNRKEKIKALLDAGRLESVPFDIEIGDRLCALARKISS